MISLWQQDFERGLLLATIVMSVDLVIGFIASLVFQSPLISDSVGSLGFIELGVFLIVGGCLASRQPLDESARYNKDGEPTSAWRMARIGRQFLFAALILFAYVGLISVVSYFIRI